MSRISALELAAFLHCEALVMLQAFFDESGMHGDARVTCIAGYVATADAWASMESRWQAVFDPYRHLGVTHWHSTDMPGLSGVFRNIDAATKDTIRASLVNVLKESDLCVIWNGIDTADFAKFVAPNAGRRKIDPYDMCFYWVIRQLIFWRMRNKFDGRIGMMFGIHDRYNSRSEVSLKSWKQFNLMEELDSISFGYPKNYPPLQSADMLSNEIYRCWLKLVDGRTERFVASDLLIDISRNSLDEGGFANEAALRSALTSDAWTDPQLICARQP
jgi:Protein of unknown function (DUF3800)